MGLRCACARYLGGYIGDDGSKNDFLKKRTESWDHNIRTMRKTVGKHPQESYTPVVRAIQLKCIFILHSQKNVTRIVRDVVYKYTL